MNKFNESTIKEETGINRELFNKHCHYQTPPALLKDLYKTNNKEKNSLLVSVINSGLKELEEKLKRSLEMKKKLKSQFR